jgi:subtilisin family serine protease
VLGDDGWGYTSWWAAGIVYAVDNGAQVINMSLVSDYNDTAMCDAVAYAKASDVAVFASAGNYDTTAPSYPASCEDALSIAATNHKDERAIPFCWGGGSNYGDKIFLSAPGDNIYGYGTVHGQYSGYYCGTSQASPHVAGAAALLLSVDPSLSVDEIKTLLADGAEDLVGRASEDTEGWDPYHGWGRLNAFNSLKLLLKQNSGTVTTVVDTGIVDTGIVDTGIVDTGTLTSSTTTTSVTTDTSTTDTADVSSAGCGCRNVGHTPRYMPLWLAIIGIFFRARRQPWTIL